MRPDPPDEGDAIAEIVDPFLEFAREPGRQRLEFDAARPQVLDNEHVVLKSRLAVSLVDRNLEIEGR